MQKQITTKKAKLLAVVSALMIGIFGVSSLASAASVSTSEFGTLTYSLAKSGSTVTAKTNTTKKALKLITKMEVQLNSTGATIINATVTKTNATSAPLVKTTNQTSVKLAAFSAHEARGNSSVAKYLATTF